MQLYKSFKKQEISNPPRFGRYALVDFGLAHKVKSQPNEMKLKSQKTETTPPVKPSPSVKPPRNPLSPTTSSQDNKQVYMYDNVYE